MSNSKNGKNEKVKDDVGDKHGRYSGLKGSYKLHCLSLESIVSGEFLHPTLSM